MTDRAKPIEINVGGCGDFAQMLSALRVGQVYRVTAMKGGGRPDDVSTWREDVTLRQVDDARALLRRSLAMLEEREWVGFVEKRCLVCNNRRSIGHDHGCPAEQLRRDLRAALGEGE